ncbi:MAG: response regulator [Verrucomicrobiota bacterium]|nr:response regulator [Verrucomicrobiota bacterium]
MSENAKKKILLVDDEKHLLMSLKDYLTFEEFEVLTARSGEEALKALEKAAPDLIVLDISMPGMGGVGFLRRISNEHGIPRYPVLVLTARSAMREFFDTVEVDGFLEKPCDESDLLAKIRKIFVHRMGPGVAGERGRQRILLAEDDASVADRLCEALRDAGYDVEVARSGPEALEKATMVKPSLIVMKEILPRLNGSAAASLIEVMPSVSTIPVILYDETRAGSPEAGSRRRDVKRVRRVLHTSDSAEVVKAVSDAL